jgi:hypothetical protein
MCLHACKCSPHTHKHTQMGPLTVLSTKNGNGIKTVEWLKNDMLKSVFTVAGQKNAGVM